MSFQTKYIQSGCQHGTYGTERIVQRIAFANFSGETDTEQHKNDVAELAARLDEVDDETYKRAVHEYISTGLDIPQPPDTPDIFVLEALSVNPNGSVKPVFGTLQHAHQVNSEYRATTNDDTSAYADRIVTAADMSLPSVAQLTRMYHPAQYVTYRHGIHCPCKWCSSKYGALRYGQPDISMPANGWSEQIKKKNAMVKRTAPGYIDYDMFPFTAGIKQSPTNNMGTRSQIVQLLRGTVGFYSHIILPCAGNGLDVIMMQNVWPTAHIDAYCAREDEFKSCINNVMVSGRAVLMHEAHMPGRMQQGRHLVGDGMPVVIRRDDGGMSMDDAFEASLNGAVLVYIDAPWTGSEPGIPVGIKVGNVDLVTQSSDYALKLTNYCAAAGGNMTIMMKVPRSFDKDAFEANMKTIETRVNITLTTHTIMKSAPPAYTVGTVRNDQPVFDFIIITVHPKPPIPFDNWKALIQGYATQCAQICPYRAERYIARDSEGPRGTSGTSFEAVTTVEQPQETATHDITTAQPVGATTHDSTIAQVEAITLDAQPTTALVANRASAAVLATESTALAHAEPTKTQSTTQDITSPSPLAKLAIPESHGNKAVNIEFPIVAPVWHDNGDVKRRTGPTKGPIGMNIPPPPFKKQHYPGLAEFIAKTRAEEKVKWDAVMAAEDEDEAPTSTERIVDGALYDSYGYVCEVAELDDECKERHGILGSTVASNALPIRYPVTDNKRQTPAAVATLQNLTGRSSRLNWRNGSALLSVSLCLIFFAQLGASQSTGNQSPPRTHHVPFYESVAVLALLAIGCVCVFFILWPRRTVIRPGSVLVRPRGECKSSDDEKRGPTGQAAVIRDTLTHPISNPLQSRRSVMASLGIHDPEGPDEPDDMPTLRDDDMPDTDSEGAGWDDDDEMYDEAEHAEELISRATGQPITCLNPGGACSCDACNATSRYIADRRAAIAAEWQNRPTRIVGLTPVEARQLTDNAVLISALTGAVPESMISYMQSSPMTMHDICEESQGTATGLWAATYTNSGPQAQEPSSEGCTKGPSRAT